MAVKDDAPEAVQMDKPAVEEKTIPSKEAKETKESKDSTETTKTKEPEPTETHTTAPPMDAPSDSPTLDRARAFLRDDAVKNEPRARKAAFLTTKGFSNDQIEAVLAEADAETIREVKVKDKELKEVKANKELTSKEAVWESSSSAPPIVTYPEFLARPPRPPPLVTPGGFLATLYASAAAASLVYGSARFVLAPMIESLTDARAQLQETTRDGLDKVVHALEEVVQLEDAPAKNPDEDAAAHAATLATGTTADDVDGDDDVAPAVFSRDAAVQTSTATSGVVTPSSSSASASASASAPYANLAAMADSVRRLCDDWSGPDVVLGETQNALDGLRADVERLRHQPNYGYGAYGIYGVSDPSSASKAPAYVSTTRNEPDDEIRRAKENIRRVKGALLTTRTFPTARWTP